VRHRNFRLGQNETDHTPNESAIIVRVREEEENFKKSFTTDSKVVELKELCVRMAALLSSDPDPGDTSLVDWTPPAV
jgi:hypothetical protein